MIKRIALTLGLLVAKSITGMIVIRQGASLWDSSLDG